MRYTGQVNSYAQADKNAQDAALTVCTVDIGQVYLSLSLSFFYMFLLSLSLSLSLSLALALSLSLSLALSLSLSSGHVLYPSQEGCVCVCTP